MAASPRDSSLLYKNDLPSINISSVGYNTADSSGITIPFSRVGNLILVKATADTAEGSFILDTGCPGLVLNLTYFRHYPLLEEGNIERKGITGSVEAAVRTMITDFTFAEKHHYRIEADLVNLGHIENSKGVKILGLIGMQLLRNYEMIVDYEKNLVHLYSIGRKESNSYRHEILKDTAAYRTMPVEIVSDRLILRANIGGKKLRLIIDSGAEINILDSRLPDYVFEQVSITNRTLLNGVGSAKVEALQGNLSGMMVEGQPLETMPVLITNLEKSCFANGGCADGVIGFDILTAKKIGFNFVKRKMYIWK